MVYQRPVIVTYATLPEPVESSLAKAQPPGKPAAPSLVQDIVSLFNATVSDQARPT